MDETEKELMKLRGEFDAYKEHDKEKHRSYETRFDAHHNHYDKIQSNFGQFRIELNEVKITNEVVKAEVHGVKEAVGVMGNSLKDLKDEVTKNTKNILIVLTGFSAAVFIVQLGLKVFNLL